ncbi:hypothetical protein B0T20DRAFT_457050 [Sordaria brevicollis]|uniref:Ig-like domain-containing protein n=1 Tax=Sordaria brevicollis TaxID=83679 RepID=A0AAE0U341_SORBR|nr:hypothetical protein B0T20DRAFT_457050 [Sordaria brevicollis]
MEEAQRALNSSDIGSDSDRDERTAVMGHGDDGTREEYEDDNSANSYDVTIDLGRTVVVDRQGIMKVQCRSCAVVHGRLEPGLGKYATLLVYDVSFLTIKKSRRITWAKIEFNFASSEHGGETPEVWSIAPAGTVSLHYSSQGETIRRWSGLTVGGPELLIANVNASLGWEKEGSKTTSDSARVIGITTCDKYGEEVGVSWIMEENKALKSGVPNFLRCAMLVKRGDQSRFECNVSISAKADWKTELGRLVGSTTETDDPVYFDPQLPPFSRPGLRDLEVENFDLKKLSSVNLDVLANARF